MTRTPPSCASSMSPDGGGKASNFEAPGQAKSSFVADGSGRAPGALPAGNAYVAGGERTSMDSLRSLNSWVDSLKDLTTSSMVYSGVTCRNASAEGAFDVEFKALGGARKARDRRL